MNTSKISMLAIAAIAAISCVKESPVSDVATPESNYVPMTFTAYTEGEDTKAAVSAVQKVYTLTWQGTEETPEKISVLSANTSNKEFNTKTSGTSAEFSGDAKPGEDLYYAVYPYTSDLILDGSTIQGVTFPIVQSPVKGTFAPDAFVAVAKSEATSFSFKTLGTLIRFQVEEGFTGSVTVSGNDNENVAGVGNVTFNGDIPSWTATDASKTATMEGEFEAGAEYYMVIAANDYAKGITISYTVGANRYYETIVSDLGGVGTTTRNIVLNLCGSDLVKTLQSRVNNTDTPNDLYVAWLHGYDIAMSTGVSYNKTTLTTTPILMTSTSASKELKSGLYFIEPDAGAQLSSGISNLVVIGRYNNQRSTISRTAGYSLMTPSQNDTDLFILKNVKWSDNTTNYLFGSNSGTFEQIILDNCYFKIATGKKLMYLDDNRIITDIRISNCDIEYESGSSDLIQDKNPIQNLTLKNNLIFSQSVMTGFKILNSVATHNNIELLNNTFYNMMNDGASFLNAQNISNLNSTGNFFVYCNPTTAGKSNLISSVVPNTYTYDLNVYVRHAGTSTAIYAHTGIYEQAKPKNAPSGMLTNWNPTEGHYGISGKYSDSEIYGATR